MLNEDELKARIKVYFEEKDIKTMIKWHLASVQSGYDYVIFVIRRSYVIALAMEKITGVRMTNDNTVYLTDGAAVNYCAEFTEYFKRNKKFPKILLVDDILEYGRNINGVLEKLMKGIKKFWTDIGETVDDISIYKLLAEKVSINVLAKVRRKSLILDFFRNNINACSIITTRDKHALSSNLALFVNAIDVSNASYICTSQFKRDMMKSNLTPLVTRYQGCREKAYIDYLQYDNSILSVISLRFIEVVGANCFRAIPFVILPELTFNQKKQLIEHLMLRVQSGNYKYLNSNIFSEKYYSERTINEWILMLLSNAILNEYYDNSGLTEEERKSDIENETQKLGRNYGRPGFNAQKAIVEMIENPPLKNVKELKSLLDDILTSNNVLFRYSDGDRCDSAKVKEKIENLFYTFEYNDTIDMYNYAKHNLVMDKPILCKYVRKFSDVTEYLSECFSFKESKYMIAYLMQMMDGGFINAAANSDKCEKNSEKYIIQNVRVAEQSQIIYPFRLHEYIPMLVEAWWTCEFEKMDIEKHLMAYKDSSYCNLEIRDNIRPLVLLSKILRATGETPDDININYFGRTDGYDPEDVFNTRINRMLEVDRANKIRDSYRAFRNSVEK